MNRSLSDVYSKALPPERQGEASFRYVLGMYDLLRRLTEDFPDVRFEGCDAGELSVRTDTGDVTGTLLSGKVFLVQSDTGRVEVPKTVSGGRCEIATDTGDILIETP